jgi:hypothetical protein
MNLASSSYYYKAKTDAAGRPKSDTALRDQIERIQGVFPGYGYRRLGRQLRREGIRVNDKRIRRLQRKYQLYPVRCRLILQLSQNHSLEHQPILRFYMQPYFS